MHVAKPLYHEHVEQLADAIARGEIASGERLPSHRDYAYQTLVGLPGT